ncbi:hypothetical protein [Massilia arenae]|uniref:AlgX/AlgJ SGNH hydrolase-like domain-containing protein n=1 Tax=Massilia arenae TaxID=2603288 RepID=A0A5C7G129_9BURK|nr:hypothetical protein [Massilia arenae]TXF96063.1 hypothetical protein FVD38_25650 [Massilia arenae]
MVRGYIDRFDSTIAGWAFDPSAPGRAVDVVIENDGREIYRCSAGLIRQDLIPVIGGAEHGFSFDANEKNGFYRSMDLKIYMVSSERRLLYEGGWVYEGMVAQGVDNWLFLNTDFNQVNLRIAGKVGVEPEKIYRTALQFATREALLAKKNIPYASIIVPEKNVICARYFPELVVSDYRPVPLIIDETRKFNCSVIYPIDEFLSSNIDVFYKTDTHANAEGYRIIYRLLQKKLPQFFDGVCLPPVAVNQKYYGDLGGKLDPAQSEVTDRYLRPETEGHFHSYDRISETIQARGRLRGEVVSVLNRNATKRLLVFGTSTAYAALPLVSCAFAHTLFIWENTFDYKIIEEFSPDCVLWLPAERFLPMEVDDLKGLPLSYEKVEELLK